MNMEVRSKARPLRACFWAAALALAAAPPAPAGPLNSQPGDCCHKRFCPGYKGPVGSLSPQACFGFFPTGWQAWATACATPVAGPVVAPGMNPTLSAPSGNGNGPELIPAPRPLENGGEPGISQGPPLRSSPYHGVSLPGLPNHGRPPY